MPYVYEIHRSYYYTTIDLYWLDMDNDNDIVEFIAIRNTPTYKEIIMNHNNPSTDQPLLSGKIE